jgi:hypothetical protein
MKKSELKELIREEIQKTISEAYEIETFERMEDIANSEALNQLKEAINELYGVWMEEGFDKEDVFDYLKFLTLNP